MARTPRRTKPSRDLAGWVFLVVGWVLWGGQLCILSRAGPRRRREALDEIEGRAGRGREGALTVGAVRPGMPANRTYRGRGV